VGGGVGSSTSEKEGGHFKKLRNGGNRQGKKKHNNKEKGKSHKKGKVRDFRPDKEGKEGQTETKAEKNVMKRAGKGLSEKQQSVLNGGTAVRKIAGQRGVGKSRIRRNSGAVF